MAWREKNKFESVVNKHTALNISLIFVYTKLNVCTMSESRGRFLPMAERAPLADQTCCLGRSAACQGSDWGWDRLLILAQPSDCYSLLLFHVDVDITMGKPGAYQACLCVSGGQSIRHRDAGGFLLDSVDEVKRTEVCLDPAGQHLFAQLVLTRECKNMRNVRAPGSLNYLIKNYSVQKK